MATTGDFNHNPASERQCILHSTTTAAVIAESAEVPIYLVKALLSPGACYDLTFVFRAENQFRDSPRYPVGRELPGCAEKRMCRPLQGNVTRIPRVKEEKRNDCINENRSEPLLADQTLRFVQGGTLG